MMRFQMFKKCLSPFHGIVLFTIFYFSNVFADSVVSRNFECEVNRDFYIKKNESLKNYQVDCARSYHLYQSAVEYSKSEEKLKLASWNIFKLGNGESRFKDLKLTALMINKWDIAAIQEVFPYPGRTMTMIENAIGYYPTESEKEGRYTEEELAQLFPPQAYIKLLEELNKLDPSWSLQLSSHSSGKASVGADEMFGFFYRSAKVRPVENPFCSHKVGAKSFGCMLDLLEQEQPVAKNPFIASFEAGNFDFTIASLHLRFRGLDSKELTEKYQKELLGDEDLTRLNAPMSDKDRLIELRAIANELSNYLGSEVTKDKDLMIMGDFNLSISEVSDDASKSQMKKFDNWEMNWRLALGSLQHFSKTIVDLTSLGAQDMSNNYDHFFFDEFETIECDAHSAKPFNFTDVENMPQDGFYQMLISKYLNIENPEQLVFDEVTQRYRSYKTINRRKKDERGLPKIINLETPAKIKRKEMQFLENVILSQQIPEKKMEVFVEILSDHIPITMECDITKEDDD